MSPPQRIPALLFGASALALLGALAFQYIGGLEPCVLCIYQRWPYVAVLGLSLLALMLGGNRTTRGVLLYLCAGTFIVGLGLAVYHVGIEQGIFEGTAACGGVATPETLEELRAQLEAAPVVRCDEVAWSLFGISLAGYNGLISLALAAFSFTAARIAPRRRMFS